MLRLYGIRNCDTVKKARDWLSQHGLEYQFVDIRNTPIDSGTFERWRYTCGWEALVNKRSRTWRELPEAEKEALAEHTALELLAKYPTLLKRPVLEIDTHNTLIGFDVARYRQHLHVA
ncbi:MAG: Spx/MgsR family RNA polymerase-binding regulatory protein [Gammaproteobacteria bacterium]